MANESAFLAAFHTGYWGKRVEIKDHPMSARIDGRQYILGAESDKLPRSSTELWNWQGGTNGATFHIAFDDGRLVVSQNLWQNGEIPPEFREQLPDNARFVTKDEFTNLAQLEPAQRAEVARQQRAESTAGNAPSAHERARG